MSEDDRRYFRQRAEDEALRAQQATQPEIAAVHSQFAAAYRERLGSSEPLKRINRA